ncbi:GntR family transcriptional regulator [Feifania hominis]|uniref:GntR family transcriptional regulator n=1 Tax=Feifania hominis TaxID=2763660 RepID=A0A926DDW7_9FIRM|nr:GntR family transcriptional regulator [Feifania hominis]MBC8536051.1 GntR family transcriptional regulator [Feifania hominis]
MQINTDSVSKQIYSLIRQDILSRKLKPGDKIDTRGIAEANGVSVMPVRNALQQLTTNGLVVNRERVGFFVRKYSVQEVKQIIDVRKMFELYCITNFFDRIDLGAAASLLDLLESTDNRATLELLDSKIHKLLVYASENKFLIDEYEHMDALFSIGIYGGKHVNTMAAKREHIDILKAILAGDREAAGKHLFSHLERAQIEIIEVVEE